MCSTACFVVKGTFLQPMEKSAGGTLVDCILAKQVDKFMNFIFRVSTLKRLTPYSILAVLSLLFQYLSRENLTSQATSTDLASTIFYRKSPIRRNLKIKIVIKCEDFFFLLFICCLNTFKRTQRFGSPGNRGQMPLLLPALINWQWFPGSLSSEGSTMCHG